MPAVKGVGEPYAGEPHARIEVAAGGDLRQSAVPRGAGASRRPYASWRRRGEVQSDLIADPARSRSRLLPVRLVSQPALTVAPAKPTGTPSAPSQRLRFSSARLG